MTHAQPVTGRMPVLFVGHGSPMNALGNTPWSQGFAKLEAQLPTPQAILVISAHWYVPGTYLTAQPTPRTIHDFGGFPPPLYEMQYPAPGSPSVARRVRTLIGETRAALSEDWGLDHGTWTVLKFTHPEASIPVVQLSIDRRLDATAHFELAQSLAQLREEGVLIVGSGNLTHNLSDAFSRMRSENTQTPDWAARFDAVVAEVLGGRETGRLLQLVPGTDDGRMAHPTPDHWLPLLYAYAATDAHDTTRFINEGFDAGSLSMRSVVFTNAPG